MLDKILCVDDDPITLMLCRKVVERVDFAKEIITAKNGLEAIEYFDSLFEERKVNDSIVYPELVLLDLNMPVMDGYTSTKKIREFNQDTPIMALTASATSDIREKIFAAGMQDYVTKPFDSDQLFSQMKRAMKK